MKERHHRAVVVNAYALVFGVLIVSGGRLADLFDRRRAFFIGSGGPRQAMPRRREPVGNGRVKPS